MLKKMMALLLAAAMLVMSACSGSQPNSQGSTAEASQTQTSQAQTSQGQTSQAGQVSQPENSVPGNEFVQNADGSFISGGVQFPLSETRTYTWWRSCDAQLLDLVNGDLNNNDCFKELELRTNIHYDFVIPAVGTDREKFAQMFISDSLPDIISGASYYQEGLDGGVDDGYYLDLTELIPQYMPDYYNVLKDANILADMVTPENRLVTIGMIYQYAQAPFSGFIIRQDWLDDLNLPMPETFDELENTLTAFKEKKGATVPLAFTKVGLFSMAYAYNVFFETQNDGGSSYRKGDHVVDALLENPDDMKAYLQKMHDWFDKGLLDPNFMASIGYFVDASLVNNGATGVTTCMYSQMETKYPAAMEQGARFAGMPWPKINKTDKLHMAPAAGNGTATQGVALNANIEEPEIVLAAFNYLFTEPGFLLANYGKEGDTYNIVDGKVVLTDKMLENVGNGIRLYALPSSWAPMWVDPDRQNSAFTQVALDAQKAWTPDDLEMNIPQAAKYFTPEERAELTNILGDLMTYEEEYFLKVVTGAGSFDDWDAFLAQCKNLGVERATEIRDAAFQRYLQRKSQ